MREQHVLGECYSDAFNCNERSSESNLRFAMCVQFALKLNTAASQLSLRIFSSALQAHFIWKSTITAR